MLDTSPYMLSTRLEGQVTNLLSSVDIYAVDSRVAVALRTLRRQLTDARLYTRDYQLSETREEQVDNAARGRQTLEGVRQNIIAISEYNIFSPVDVAELSSQLELIIEGLM